jgi:hypothetical protein
MIEPMSVSIDSIGFGSTDVKPENGKYCCASCGKIYEYVDLEIEEIEVANGTLEDRGEVQSADGRISGS